MFYLFRQLVEQAPTWEAFPKAAELSEDQLERQRLLAGENDRVDALAREVMTKKAWCRKGTGELYT